MVKSATGLQPNLVETALGAQMKRETVVVVNLRVRLEGERRGGQGAQELLSQCLAH